VAKPRTYRIGISTSGGDAPGMNACLRAIVKGRADDIELVGIRHGGLGLLRNRRDSSGRPDYFPLGPEVVSFSLNKSGTVLGTARRAALEEFLREECPNLSTPEAVMHLGPTQFRDQNLDGLILIGGDTTATAACWLSSAMGSHFPILVVPATIDNDIHGTEETLGFDTAVQAATESVDAVRATADSLERIFIVEVMGRKHGHIAVHVGLATGAEEVLIPETGYTVSDLRDMYERVSSGRGSRLLIVAEGVEIPGDSAPASGDASETLSPGLALRRLFEEWGPSREVRLQVLGYLQRGWSPTARTRNLAASAGLLAVDEVRRYLQNDGLSTKHPLLISINARGITTLNEITSVEVTRRDRRVVQTMALHQRRLAY
jgi:6-phosphofructokinase 1